MYERIVQCKTRLVNISVGVKPFIFAIHMLTYLYVNWGWQTIVYIYPLNLYVTGIYEFFDSLLS